MTPPSDSDFDFRQYNSSGPGSSSLSDGGSTFSDSPYAESTSSGWDDVDGQSVAIDSPAGPPFLFLAVALLLSVGGLVVAVIAGASIPLAWAGWIAAGPVAIGAFAVFTFLDTKERAKPLYGHRAGIVWAYRIGLVIALAGVAVAALRLADWVGRW